MFLCRHLKDPSATLEAILNTRITSFPGHIQSIYYQSILKIFTHIVTNDESVAKDLASTTIEKMTVFLSSGDVEAQERVCSLIIQMGLCPSIIFRQVWLLIF